MKTMSSKTVLSVISISIAALGVQLAKSWASLPDYGTTIGTARYLPSNSEAWFARYSLITNAKQKIITQYFIVDKDVMGMAFLGLLLEKLRAGVKVELMVDRRGTKKFSTGADERYLKLLVNHGATVRVFNPVLGTFAPDHFFDHLKAEALISDHQKLLIVDDRYFITGGRNISKDYLVDQSEHPGAYMDTDGVYDSPAIAKAATEAFYYETKVSTHTVLNQNDTMAQDELSNAVFAIEDRMEHDSAHLNFVTTTSYPELRDYNSLYLGPGFRNYKVFDNSPGLPHGNPALSVPVKFLANSSALHQETPVFPQKTEIRDNVIDAINNARRDIIIQNPYIILTPRMHEALLKAARRQVHITFLTNSPLSTDSLLTQAYFYSHRNALLEEMNPGKENEYLEIHAINEKKKLHAKVFVIDDDITFIGSYNMDFISEQTNAEGSVKIVSQAFNTQVRNQIHSWINQHTILYTLKNGAEQIEHINTEYGSDTKTKIMEDEFLAGLATFFQEHL